MEAAISRVLVIYDGACPFCNAYASLLRLRQSATVELLSARGDDPRVALYRAQGHRFDEGMLAVVDGVVHAGADAMHVLAAMSAGQGGWNRLQRAMFSRRGLARLLYPLLRSGRRVVLWLLRVPPIEKLRS